MARTFRFRGSRRKTEWAGFGSETGTAELPSGVAVATATPAAILSTGSIVANALGFFDQEVTIIRTIGMLMVNLNINTAVSQGSFAVGLYIARAEAIAAGIGSLPSPEDDPDAEWLAHFSGTLINPNSTARDGPLSGIQIPFDLRGQRIMKTGQSQVWIGHAENANLLIAVNGRYLVKLP